ncbi:MAG: DUF4256 domain-containing protein [Erysipelothrix sp.]|nr:DUF4256 domain-containing protein [Erysipelothrix sp.]
MNQAQLLTVLEERFKENSYRHEGVQWQQVTNRLNDYKLSVLLAMEETGGQPDVMVLHGELVYVDFSLESPTLRRSLCYDREALDKRKKNKPINSAKDVANEIGIRLLTEEEYFILQSIMPVDLSTSTWLDTPVELRKLGGALFGDRRYNRVFIYHNGADSYYASRGFRGVLNL